MKWLASERPPSGREGVRGGASQSTTFSMTHAEHLAAEAAAAVGAVRAAPRALEPLPLEPLQPGSPLVGPLPA